MLLKEGNNAIDFCLDSNVGEISLVKFTGKNIVLYFYPKDMTPGCSVQAHEFNTLYDDFKNLNTVVIGISKDTIESHIKFINKEKISFILASDVDGTTCNQYEVIKEKSIFGKKYIGISRDTFLISPERKIVKIWHKVSPLKNPHEVLDFLRKKMS